MNVKTWVPLAAALMLGVIAAVMAGRLLHGKKATDAEPGVTVIVAKVPLAPGEVIGAEQLARMPIAAKAPPPQSFTDPGELIGRVVSAPMIEGQPFQRSLLAPKGALPGLAALVPSGLRAVTVDVSESGGVAGLLAPGSHVDVVATAIGRDNPDKTITRTIVQNLTVAAVGQRLSSGHAEGDKEALPKTVTLLASPHDVEALDLAMTTSRVRLVLRAANDAEDLVDDGVMMAELRGEDGYQPPAPVTTPVIVTQPVVPAPTTQPEIFTKAPDPPPARIVTVILGAEERHVSFTQTQPDAGGSAVTDANSPQPAVPQ
ncbi:MAG TPA: Flp pilus assembly protein CpaB [Tepidisphaeraceae bacterium]|jgi:pilus assembly protein CpaB|nr:Flp pilus assembly protein CpaB [Tepidisphaeraceae bacterium]